MKKDDVEMLLLVLEFDGRVEKIPSSGLMQMSDDDDDGGKKRKNTNAKRKRKGDDSEQDESDDDRKKKRKTNMDESDEEDKPKNKRKPKGRMDSSDEDDRRSKKSKKSISIDTDSDDDGKRSRKKKSSKYNDSDSENESTSDERYGFAELDATDAYVYRAIRPVQDGFSATETHGGASMFSGSTSAWLGGGERHLPWAEAPCVRCPQFDFCEEDGPVNAAGCEYLKQWLDPDRVVAALERVKGEGEDLEAAVAVEMEN